MGLFSSSQTQSVDPKTAQYITDYRNAVQKYSAGVFGPGGAGQPFSPDQIAQYGNPYEEQVIGGVQRDFDRQRAQAMQSGADQAIGAHAYGGSRSGVLQAGLVNGVNQNEANQLANLRYGGFNNALGQLNQDRQYGLAERGQALGAWGQGMGPISQTTTQNGSIVGGLLGLATTAAGFIPGLGSASSALKAGAAAGGPPAGGGFGGALNPGYQFGSGATMNPWNQQGPGAYPGIGYAGGFSK